MTKLDAYLTTCKLLYYRNYQKTKELSIEIIINFIIFSLSKGEIPLSSKQKETETKHSIYNLDPFIKIIFGGEYTPYTLPYEKEMSGKCQRNCLEFIFHVQKMSRKCPEK